MPGPRAASLTGRWRALPDSRQDGVIAAAFLAGGVLMLLTGFGRITGGTDPVPDVRIALLAGVCVLQTQRRRHPIPILVIAVVLLGVDSLWGLTLPMLLVVTDLIHAAILYSSPASSRVVIRTTLVGSVGVVISVAVVTGDPRSTVLAALLSAALLLLPLQSSSAQRHQRERTAWERERAGTQQQLTELEHSARLARERAATARELHDVIAGHLSSIALQTSALTGADADRVPADQRSAALRTMRTSSLQALSSLQMMIVTLRRAPDSDDGQDLDPLPVTLRSDLDQLLTRFRAGGTALRVELRPDPLPRLSALVDQVAHRVVSEALTNASRHAAGRPAGLQITAIDDELTIRVNTALSGPGSAGESAADGSAAGAPSGNGYGLSNLLVRVTDAGGRFSAGVDRGGWSVECRLPLGTAS